MSEELFNYLVIACYLDDQDDSVFRYNDTTQADAAKAAQKYLIADWENENGFHKKHPDFHVRYVMGSESLIEILET